MVIDSDSEDEYFSNNVRAHISDISSEGKYTRNGGKSLRSASLSHSGFRVRVRICVSKHSILALT